MRNLVAPGQLLFRVSSRIVACGRESAKESDLMFKTWMDFVFDAARLMQETQEVIGLRMMKLASGGSAGQAEAERMVTEKNVAAVEALGTLAFGGSLHKVMRRYRSHVRANKRRLIRG
jgi:hypothetical protein